NAAGATVRHAVNATGWGTMLATTPTAHPAHRPADATVRAAWPVGLSASATAGPAVNGSAHQSARESQGSRRATPGMYGDFPRTSGAHTHVVRRPRGRRAARRSQDLQAVQPGRPPGVGAGRGGPG